jgi:hypothetical protein
MGNHYHLVIETPEGNLVSGVRRLNGVYAQWFNRRHGRVGHLFQGRYKSIIVERESYLLELCRYVVLNPVRAGIVSQPGDWKWSSYLATIGYLDKPKWLDAERILERFSRDCQQGSRFFREFVADGINAPNPWDHLRGQVWLGSKAYLEIMEKLIRTDRLEEVPLEQTKPTRPTKTEILVCVADNYGLTVGELVRRSHQNAYRTAAYLLRRIANLNLKAVAKEFKVSPSRISRIQGEIEKGYLGDSKLSELLKRYKV